MHRIIKVLTIASTKRNNMTNQIDFTIDEKELKVLFLHTQEAYKSYTFEMLCKECKMAYVTYFDKSASPKTFAQWVNGQILYLTTL